MKGFVRKKFKELLVDYNSILFFNWLSEARYRTFNSWLVVEYIVGYGRMQLNRALSRRNVVFIGGRSVSLNSNADSRTRKKKKKRKGGGDGEGGLADI